MRLPAPSDNRPTSGTGFLARASGTDFPANVPSNESARQNAVKPGRHNTGIYPGKNAGLHPGKKPENLPETNAENTPENNPEKHAVARIMADIRFLEDRMAQVESHRAPNPAVLQTYSSMLSRREMALTMLLADA